MKNEEEILEFGIKRENEERRDGGCGIVFDPLTQRYAVYKHSKSNALCLYGGGINKDEDPKEGILREIVEESGLHDFLYAEKVDKVITHYYNSNRGINRVAYATCFLVILKSTDLLPTKLEEHEKFESKWETSEKIFSSWKSENQNKDYDHWFYFFKKAISRAKELGYDTTSVLDLE